MAQTPIADRPLIAQWLIRARQSQGWSAERFLGELRDAGTSIHYSSYAQWESGTRTPREVSLAPVVAFWAERGVEGPAQPEPEPADPFVAQLLALNTRMASLLEDSQGRLAEAERRADAAERRLDALETLMLRTSSEPSLARVDEEAQAWAEAADTTSPSPRPVRPAGRG